MNGVNYNVLTLEIVVCELRCVNYVVRTMLCELCCVNDEKKQTTATVIDYILLTIF